MPDLPINPDVLRPAIFVVGLTVFSLLGFFFPYRRREEKKGGRMLHNLLLFSCNVFGQWLARPLGLFTLAHWASKQQYGLFHHSSIPAAIEFALSIVLLDLIITLQHMLTHRIPLLWRLHRVHHSDPGFDTTTALRFHPLETLLSLTTQGFFVILLGIGPATIVFFEVLINFAAMFNHSNISLPGGLDRMLRLLIVTPDMHRLHHSVERDEMNSNYGFFLSCWDRVLATYRSQTRVSAHSMPIGMKILRADEDQRIDQLLLQPFRKKS